MEKRMKDWLAWGTVIGILLAMLLVIRPDTITCGSFATLVEAGPFDHRPDPNLTVDNDHHRLTFWIQFDNKSKAFVGDDGMGATFETSRVDTSTADVAVVAAAPAKPTSIVSSWSWSKGDGSWRNAMITAVVEGGHSQRFDMYLMYGETAAKEVAGRGLANYSFDDTFQIGCQHWTLETDLHIQY